MLRRLLRRVTTRQSSVQYELQRMTHQGGWKNFYTDPDGDDAETFASPPDQPEFGPSSGWPPGRYRCVKRVDGRIADTVWTVDSPDADYYYQQQRTQARQRDRLEDLPADEIVDELADGGAFDALPREEIVQSILDKQQPEQESSTDYSALEQRLIETIAEQAGPSEAISELTEVKAAKQGVCYRCRSRNRVKKCIRCGELVCRDHQHGNTDVCTECV